MQTVREARYARAFSTHAHIIVLTTVHMHPTVLHEWPRDQHFEISDSVNLTLGLGTVDNVFGRCWKSFFAPIDYQKTRVIGYSFEIVVRYPR